MDNSIKRKLIRKAVQAGWGILTNAHFSGFFSGRIYQGPLKKFCVPGMNCYSCPGALGACPIGAMQAVLSARKPKFAFYAIGFMTAVGVLAGRFICGWLCLFGLIQELLYMIPVPKLRVPEKADHILRYLKYAFLLICAVLLPVILRDEYGMAEPFFCKWICPVGTLEGSIPLLAANEAMRSAAHFLYAWKFAILLLVLVLSMFIYRPFCKYICPLGAFYALFQKIGFLRLKIDPEACTDCGQCARACKMQVDPRKSPNSSECIRCGECLGKCPSGAICFTCAGKSTGRCGSRQTQKITGDNRNRNRKPG